MMRHFSISRVLPKSLGSIERWIHLGLWLTGLVILNWPDQLFTIGVFSSRDHELLIPSLYGTLINAAIVYGVSNMIIDQTGQIDFNLILKTLLFYLIGCGVESLVDIGHYFLLTSVMSGALVWEIILGSVIMNFFFFYVPALIYGIIKSSMKSEGSPVQKIEIQDGHHKVLIVPNDLSHVESDGNYVKFHTSKGVILERSSLTKVEGRLPATFVRCHKSFVVNKNAIEKISTTSVEVGGHKIPIGRKYKENLS
ncbi:MAG: LytTR family DNA-binding domain-containing protein [Cyclobacteriaceae bacterium]